MWQLISNEWKYYLRSRLLFWVSVGFAAVLVLTAILGQYQSQTQAYKYANATDHLRGQWESIESMNPHSAAHYGTYLFKPGGMLNGLDDGITTVTGNVLRVEGHVQNEIVYSEASQVKSVSRFGKLRSALLLQYILPLLLIFLAFVSMSNEKESGRLRLLLIQGAKPSSIIFAKALSAWLYGLALLLLVFGAYFLLNIASVNAITVTRSLFFFTSYALYYFVICGLTVYLSARWQNATLALTSMLAIWILWTIFLPSMLISYAEAAYPLPSRDQFKTAMKEDRSKGIDGHNPSDARNKELQDKVLAEYGVDSLSQLPINFDGLRMQADEEYGNIVWDKHFGNIRGIITEQKRLTQMAGLLNPFLSLRNASMGFAGSDNVHHHDFLLQAENYRRVFIKALNDKHAFGGSKTGDWGWKADNAFFKSVPKFEFQSKSTGTVLNAYAVDLVLLLLWAGLTLVLMLTSTRNMKTI